MLHPVIEAIAGNVTSVKFGKVNVDEQPELAAKYNVMSIPTLLLIKEGTVTATSIGFKPEAEILDMIKR